jgi:alpha-1,2-glucosyltransferase
MVYIWPYISFFSFPLLIPTILSVLPAAVLPASIRSNLIHRRVPATSIICFAVLVLGIVHFNTIIHPFTLADNRHYIFYVFRWLILRNFWIRYIWIPGYVVCGWLVIQSLGRSEASRRVEIMTRSTSRTRKMASVENELIIGDDANRVSFVLIWFLSTSLSLATAPLVEPRYFILPWLIWRIYVPSPQASPADSKKDGRYDIYALWTRYGLLLETLWFVAINLGTGHLFLYKGFEWPQEPRVVQRFMW